MYGPKARHIQPSAVAVDARDELIERNQVGSGFDHRQGSQISPNRSSSRCIAIVTVSAECHMGRRGDRRRRSLSLSSSSRAGLPAKQKSRCDIGGGRLGMMDAALYFITLWQAIFDRFGSYTTKPAQAVLALTGDNAQRKAHPAVEMGRPRMAHVAAAAARDELISTRFDQIRGAIPRSSHKHTIVRPSPLDRSGLNRLN